MSTLANLRTGPIPKSSTVIHTAWAWLQAHPKTRWVFLYLVIATICYNFMAAPAVADNGDSTGRTLWLPLEGVKDSQGVPIWRYTELPFDPGNGPTYVMRKIRHFTAGLLWGMYIMPIFLVIALLDWILKFEWLEWLAAPFVAVSNGIGSVLDTWAIVTLGILVSCLIIAFGYVRGKMGAATVEAIMVIIIIGIWASPLANPITYLTGSGNTIHGSGGMIQESAEFGEEIGYLAVNPDGEAANPSLTGAVIDMTLRAPMLSMSFGSPLEGDCAAKWNESAIDESKDVEKIRKDVVRACGDEVKDANDSDSGVWFMHYLMAGPATIGVMFLIAVFLIMLIMQVIQVLTSAFIAAVRAYFALFSGGSRQAWFNSIAQTFISVVLVGLLIFALQIYMYFLNEIVKLIPVPNRQIASTATGIIVIAMAITFWRMKKSGKSIGEKIAKALGKNGMHSNAEMKPSKFKAAAGSTLKAGLNKGVDLYRDNKNFRRMANLAQGGAAIASGGATGALTATATTVAKRRAVAGVASKTATTMMGGKTNGVGGAASRAARAAGTAGRAKPKSVPRAALGHGAPERLNGGIPMPAASSIDNVHPMQSASGTTQSIAPNGAPQPIQGTITDPARYANALESNAVFQPSDSSIQQPAQPMTEEFRAENLTPGRYGRTWVHADGTITTPAVPATMGAEMETVPEEPKIAQAMQSGDSWILGARQDSFDGYSSMEEEVVTTTSTTYYQPTPMAPTAPMVTPRKHGKTMDALNVGASAAMGGVQGAKNVQRPAPAPKKSQKSGGFWGFGKRSPKAASKSAFNAPKSSTPKPTSRPATPTSKMKQQESHAKAPRPAQPKPKPEAGPSKPKPQIPPMPKPTTQPRPSNGFNNRPGGNS